MKLNLVQHLIPIKKKLMKHIKKPKKKNPRICIYENGI